MEDNIKTNDLDNNIENTDNSEIAQDNETLYASKEKQEKNI